MRYPLGLVLDSAKHILAGKLRREKRFAIGVALDPIGEYSNNGRSAGGQTMLSVKQCLAALEECPAPLVSICGGEPLEYPEIQTLAREILDRGKHLFLNTDGTWIRRRLHMIPPYTNFFWNVKLDGTESVYDTRAGRASMFAEALDGVKAAKNAGFFVVVTTPVFPDTNVADVGELYRKLHTNHVDGYMLSLGYPKNPIGQVESEEFTRQRQERFRQLSHALSAYNLMISPVHLEYLCGERQSDGPIGGTPFYGPRGWSVLGRERSDGYSVSYADLARKAAG